MPAVETAPLGPNGHETRLRGLDSLTLTLSQREREHEQAASAAFMAATAALRRDFNRRPNE
jgi:hypothetical protein